METPRIFKHLFTYAALALAAGISLTSSTCGSDDEPLPEKPEITDPVDPVPPDTTERGDTVKPLPPAPPATAPCGIDSLKGFNMAVNSHTQLAEGVDYLDITYTNPEGDRKFRAYVVIASTEAATAPVFDLVVARDSLSGTEYVSSMGKRSTTAAVPWLAGVNADFFITSSFVKSNNLPTHLVGWPHMGTVTGGMLVQTNGPFDGAHDYGHLIVGRNAGEMWCDVPAVDWVVTNPSGKRTWLSGTVNWDRADSHVNLYNSGNGTRTHTSAGGLEVQAVLADGQSWGTNKDMTFVVKGQPSTAGNMAIPAGGIVLSAGPEAVAKLKTYTEGATFTVRCDVKLAENPSVAPDIRIMSGADVILLHNGDAKTTQGARDRFINPINTRYPRTMAGFSNDRKRIVMCVVDGKNVGGSTGVTYPEGGLMMKTYGCWDAVNFDGGGSSEMWLNPSCAPQGTPSSGIVNTPSDGYERAVGSGLFIRTNTSR